MKHLVSIFLIVASLFAQAQDAQIVFDISFKGNTIGALTASQKKQKLVSNLALKTQTESKVLMVSVHVEPEVQVKKENNVLTEGIAYRHSNRGSADVHAHVKRNSSSGYDCERNGKSSQIQVREITFCVIDLYFNEPKGLNSVFSNMYAQQLKLVKVGEGKYEVVTPDNKNTYYTYKSGRLISVEADTPLGKVISTRR